jgi:chorismate mutase
MKEEEIIESVKRINARNGKPVDEELLAQIIALVMKNPIEEDRQRCQSQIREIIYQRKGEKA